MWHFIAVLCFSKALHGDNLFRETFRHHMLQTPTGKKYEVMKATQMFFNPIHVDE